MPEFERVSSVREKAAMASLRHSRLAHLLRQSLASFCRSRRGNHRASVLLEKEPGKKRLLSSPGVMQPGATETGGEGILVNEASGDFIPTQRKELKRPVRVGEFYYFNCIANRIPTNNQ